MNRLRHRLGPQYSVRTGAYFYPSPHTTSTEVFFIVREYILLVLRPDLFLPDNRPFSINV